MAWYSINGFGLPAMALSQQWLGIASMALIYQQDCVWPAMIQSTMAWYKRQWLWFTSNDCTFIHGPEYASIGLNMFHGPGYVPWAWVCSIRPGYVSLGLGMFH